jgi:hypothetical protein
MSALDFGDGTGLNAGTNRRQFTVTFPELPNSDWYIATWIRMNNNRAGNVGAAAGHGTNASSVESSWVMRFLSDTQLLAECRNVGGSNSYMPFTHGGIDSNDYLWVMQRNGSNFQTFFVLEGATVSAATASVAVTGTVISTHTARIGMNSFNFNDGWPNPEGEFMLDTSKSLTNSEITAMAAGARPTSTPLILLPFRDGNVATEANIGTGGSTYDATRVLNGTAVFNATETDFFSLGAVVAPRIITPIASVRF